MRWVHALLVSVSSGLATGALLVITTPAAHASYCGVGNCFARHHRCRCDSCPTTKCECHTVTKTVTKTVYDQICEKKQKTVYDTVWDEQTVHDVHREAVTRYRQEEFTYQRPVYETRSKDVPYTAQWQIQETRSQTVQYLSYVPTYETRTRSVPYTTYRTVYDTQSRPISYCVPREVTYTKTIQVHTGCWGTRTEECPGPIRQKCVREPGCWKWDPCCCRCVYVPGKCKTVEVQCPPVKVCRKVWVPRVEDREVTCTKTVYDTKVRQVSYTVSRLVPETHTHCYEYTVARMVPVPQTRVVHYQVPRMVSQQQSRTVNYVVQSMVTETGTRSVPFTTWNEIPITRTVCVPRQVPRTVCYTETRSVPRTVTCEVKVRVCVPVPCGSKGPACGCDDASADGAPTPPADDMTAGAYRPDTSVGRYTGTVDGGADDASSARGHFTHGLNRYWSGDLAAAEASFKAAVEAEPTGAKYAYFRALALYRMGREADAEQAVAEAARLERDAPVAGWGKLMERVQGAPRIWIEKARRGR